MLQNIRESIWQPCSRTKLYFVILSAICRNFFLYVFHLPQFFSLRETRGSQKVQNKHQQGKVTKKSPKEKRAWMFKERGGKKIQCRVDLRTLEWEKKTRKADLERNWRQQQEIGLKQGDQLKFINIKRFVLFSIFFRICWIWSFSSVCVEKRTHAKMRVCCYFPPVAKKQGESLVCRKKRGWRG